MGRLQSLSKGEVSDINSSDFQIDLPSGWGSLSAGVLSGHGDILALPLHPAKENGQPQVQATGCRQDTEAVVL